jgi:hypothetical protein
MTNQVYIKIMRTGWKNLLRTNPFHIIAIIVQERIMAMLNEPGWPLENPPPVAGSKSPTPVVGRTGVI